MTWTNTFYWSTRVGNLTDSIDTTEFLWKQCEYNIILSAIYLMMTTLTLDKNCKYLLFACRALFVKWMRIFSLLRLLQHVRAIKDHSKAQVANQNLCSVHHISFHLIVMWSEPSLKAKSQMQITEWSIHHHKIFQCTIAQCVHYDTDRWTMNNLHIIQCTE